MIPHVPWRGWGREWLRPNMIAGLTGAAVVIPKAMASARVAGLPVQAGLYTALVPTVVYALLGTSRSPEHPHDESWPGLLLLRIEGRLSFANAQRVADLTRSGQQRTLAHVVVTDSRSVVDVEYTALKVLEVVVRSGIGTRIGRERMFVILQAAVEAYQRRGEHHEAIEHTTAAPEHQAPCEA